VRAPSAAGPYNNNIEIVQTSDAVVVLSEMIHDARIVALDGRSAPPASMRSWLGSSRGRWEGDTLIVETTNFAKLVTFRGSDERTARGRALHAGGKDALRYEFTIDDPTAFTRQWTGSYTMTRTADRIYEYACHEGNFGLLNILSQARVGRERLSDAIMSRYSVSLVLSACLGLEHAGDRERQNRTN
jgi:hypothetical protein